MKKITKAIIETDKMRGLRPKDFGAVNPFEKLTFDTYRQEAVYRANPKLAKEMKAEVLRKELEIDKRLREQKQRNKTTE